MTRLPTLAFARPQRDTKVHDPRRSTHSRYPCDPLYGIDLAVMTEHIPDNTAVVSFGMSGMPLHREKAKEKT